MATKKQSRHKGPALTWRRPKDLNELWEAVAPGGGRYVIRLIGAYRTGATRYDVHLRSTSYHSAYLGDFKTATTAKRVAGAHANRLAARMRATPQGTTTRGPWDSAGGKRRSAKGKKSSMPPTGTTREFKGPVGWKIVWVIQIGIGGRERNWYAIRKSDGWNSAPKKSKAAALSMAKRMIGVGKRRAAAAKKPSGSSSLGTVISDINRLVK